MAKKKIRKPRKKKGEIKETAGKAPEKLEPSTGVGVIKKGTNGGVYTPPSWA